MSEDNAAKPTKTVRCRLFRGRFNKGWTKTIGAVIRSGLFAKPFAKVSTRNAVVSMVYGEWCNGSTTDSDSVCLGSNPSSPASKIKDLAGISRIGLPRNRRWEGHGKASKNILEAGTCQIKTIGISPASTMQR